MKKLLISIVACAISLSAMSQVEAPTTLSQHSPQVQSAQNLAVLASISNGTDVYVKKLDSLVQQTYNSLSASYTNAIKQVYTYDANGNQLTQLSYVWNATINKWQNAYSYSYVYDTSNNDIQETVLAWNTTTNKWQNNQKNIYTYDVNSYLVQKDDSLWNSTTSKWVYLSQDIYNNNVNGNPLTRETYAYNTFGLWQELYKYAYTYDANDNNTITNYSIYNPSTYAWENNAQTYQYTYDSNSNQTSEIDQVNSVDTNKYQYTYNNSYTTQQLMLPQWLQQKMPHNHNQLTSEQIYTYSAGSWIQAGQAQYYYSPILGIPNGINNTSSTSVSLSPNPATDMVQVKWTDDNASLKLAIYTLGGQLVWQQTVSNNAIVSIGNLPAGVYIYNLSNGAKGKLIKN
jgi:hypothetical protein